MAIFHSYFDITRGYMSNTIALSIEVSLGTLGLLDIGSVGHLFQVQTSENDPFLGDHRAFTINHMGMSENGVYPQ